jgi:hypothetical protein
MDDEEYSLNQFDEHLDGHFGETALPKGSERWRDDALPGNEVNGHKVNERQRAALQGRKLIVHNRAASAPEETLICRGGEWQPLGPSKGLIACGYSYAPPPDSAKPCLISEEAKANPVKSNLRVRSPRLPNLDAEEETRLVLAAQSGDQQAAKKLLEHFHGWIRHVAWKPWLRLQKRNFKADIISSPQRERSETIDDYVGAGILAFWESVDTWKPGRNGLFAYAVKHVYGAISNVVWARKATGFKDESNLARFIRAHPYEPLAAFKKFFGKYKPFQVYQEIARQGFLVAERDEYSEGSVRDQGSGDGCPIEKGGTTKISDDGSFNRPLFIHNTSPNVLTKRLVIPISVLFAICERLAGRLMHLSWSRRSVGISRTARRETLRSGRGRKHRGKRRRLRNWKSTGAIAIGSYPRRENMDITMMLGGLFVALTAGMEPEGVERAIDCLGKLAERGTPAENYVFKCIADSMAQRPSQAPSWPSLRVIEGGAA